MITMIKNGREMQVNPNPDGVKILKDYGWKVKGEKTEQSATTPKSQKL